jgi:hypothetical protein
VSFQVTCRLLSLVIVMLCCLEADALLQVADKNRDGELTFAELASHVRFLGNNDIIPLVLIFA